MEELDEKELAAKADIERIEMIRELAKEKLGPDSLRDYLIVSGASVEVAEEAFGAFASEGFWSNGSSSWGELKS